MLSCPHPTQVWAVTGRVEYQDSSGWLRKEVWFTLGFGSTGEDEDGDEDEEAEAGTGKRAAEDDENDNINPKKQKTDEDD